MIKIKIKENKIKKKYKFVKYINYKDIKEDLSIYKFIHATIKIDDKKCNFIFEISKN